MQQKGCGRHTIQSPLHWASVGNCSRYTQRFKLTKLLARSKCWKFLQTRHRTSGNTLARNTKALYVSCEISVEKDPAGICRSNLARSNGGQYTFCCRPAAIPRLGCYTPKLSRVTASSSGRARMRGQQSLT